MAIIKNGISYAGKHRQIKHFNVSYCRIEVHLNEKENGTPQAILFKDTNELAEFAIRLLKSGIPATTLMIFKKELNQLSTIANTEIK